MASWKKYLKNVTTQARLNTQLKHINNDGGASGASNVSQHKSFLPEVYAGTPNRIERYSQYLSMDLDSEISRALDTIADFSTQTNEITQEPFNINFKNDLTETEIKLINQSLQQWCSLNKWQQRLWRMFRNTIMYGDQIFIRDPETFKLIWIDPTKVEKIIVNESSGKEIEQYVIRELDINLQTLIGSNMLVHDQYAFPGGYPRSGNPASGAGTINYGISSSPGSRNSRFDNMPGQVAVNAEHVLHLSISEGLDNQWPFGISILESIYKVFKQKDLLEDAILIYRIVRAPERRVFYIDTGSLSGPRAMAYVEKIKTDIYQRRIPSRSANGSNVIDSSYNPMCLDLNTRIPLLDGRTLELNEIISEFESGKENWVYSCDPITGEVMPGIIDWAGITRKNTETIELTFDNGKTLISTPDHKIPVLGKGFVEAKDLTINDSLIAFSQYGDVEYQKVWDISKNEWVWTYDLIDSKYNINNKFKKSNSNDKQNPNRNARIISIRVVESRDTGTITVDGFEKYHSHHTFAIDAGIFVKNSMNEDFYLAVNSEGRGTKIESLAGGDNLGCLSLDTKVKLLDGRDLSIIDIENEMKEGKTLWTYSCHPVTGAIVPGKITWAGKTKSNAKVMKITLDNGETVTSTLDHRFPIKGQGMVEAQNLSIGQSLISLELQESTLSYNGKKTYLQVFNHCSGKWAFVHRLVAEYFKGTKEERTKFYRIAGDLNVVHHNDYNKFNNDPSNLYWMNAKDHITFHNENLQMMKEKDPEGYAKRSQAIIDANNRRWKKDPDRKMHAEQETLKYTEFMYQKVTDYYNSGYKELQIIAEQLNADSEFIEHWKSINNTLHSQSKYCDFQNRHIHSILKNAGLDWDRFRVINEKINPANFSDEFKSLLKIVKNSKSQVDFVTKSNLPRHEFMEKIYLHNFQDYRMVKAFTETYNHRIINIEILEETMDVGCLTIDGDEEFHNYHSFALSAGVLCENSIDDLRYFSNKMIRGLGVPSSYLPTGADDGTANYNDGKVGAAYIQEFRFSQYCKRLQNLIAPALDKEFKLFVKDRGIEISSNLFELQFFPPQSFGEYRQIQVDSEQIGLFSNLMSTDANKYLSKRFALKRYLGWTDAEILENESLWKEENANKTRSKTGVATVDNRFGLNSVGVTAPPDDDFGSNFGNDEDVPPEGNEGGVEPGSETATNNSAAPPGSVGQQTGTTVNSPPELGPGQ